MPAKSKAQQALFAIAEHSPGKLIGSNKELGDLPKSVLHEFSSTSTKGLPRKIGKGSYERFKKRKEEGPK